MFRSVEILPPVIIAFFAAAVVFGLVLASRKFRDNRERFIREYAFPSTVRERLSQKHPDWFGADIERALHGLREFFLMCLATPRAMVPMTSKPADDAWHEFILCTNDYEWFCKRAFGGYLHHKPDEAKAHMGSDAAACGGGVAIPDTAHGHGHGHVGCSGGHGHGCSGGTSHGCSGGTGH
jgi:hypothetical protein